MKTSLLILSIVVIGLLAVGCDKTVQQGTEYSQLSIEDHGAMVMEADDTVQLAGNRVEMKNKDNFKTGRIALTFTLHSAGGNELKPEDLKVAHEKLVHLILIREDDTEFQHIHPEYIDGQWAVTTTMPKQGLYQMYADIVPKHEPPVVLRVPFTIGGPTQSVSFPKVSSGGLVSVDGINAVLQNADAFKSGEAVTLRFSLTKHGKPVTDVGPYLGAFGHAVILQQGKPDVYLHTHPITEAKPTGGEVEFRSEFPAAGMYTIFAQFIIDGQLKTFPITVAVGS